MKATKQHNKKVSVANARKLCIMALSVMIDEYTGFAYDSRYDQKEITAYAKAVTRLAETARSKKHLTELLFALEAEIADDWVPLDERGTELLRRVSKRRRRKI